MSQSQSELAELSHAWVDDSPDPECIFTFAVPESTPMSEAHFPGSALLPAFSQLGAVVSRVHRVWPQLGQWQGASSIKFKAPIRPGSKVELRLTRTGPGTVKFAFRVEETLCANGTLAFAEPEGEAT
ncbi:MAG: hypothetical protein JKY37_34085 [Nannocystaceae bacterium]|nr:hypothetical protein [Nannocystaceae bacterium]